MPFKSDPDECLMTDKVALLHLMWLLWQWKYMGLFRINGLLIQSDMMACGGKSKRSSFHDEGKEKQE